MYKVRTNQVGVPFAELQVEQGDNERQKVRGPPDDPQTKLVATPARSQGTTGDADVGVVTHGLFGQAGASGLVNPRASSTAGSDSEQDLDRLLISEGFRPFRQMTNDYVEEVYGVCSRTSHLVRMYENPELRIAMRAKLDFAMGEVDEEMGCIPMTGNRMTLTYNCKKRGCTRRKTQLHLDLNRVLAILNEPPQHAWMGAITHKLSSPTYPLVMFHGSGMCNKFQGGRHCIHQEHVFLETIRQNMRRKGHHYGDHTCDCEPRCLGALVVRDRPGRKDYASTRPRESRDELTGTLHQSGMFSVFRLA
jgi:hypothetical protein